MKPPAYAPGRYLLFKRGGYMIHGFSWFISAAFFTFGIFFLYPNTLATYTCTTYIYIYHNSGNFHVKKYSCVKCLCWNFSYSNNLTHVQLCITCVGNIVPVFNFGTLWRPQRFFNMKISRITVHVYTPVWWVQWCIYLYALIWGRCLQLVILCAMYFHLHYI